MSTIELTGQCELIAVDRREYEALRKLKEAVNADNTNPRVTITARVLTILKTLEEWP